MTRIVHLKKCLDKMINLLEAYMDLVNTCMVDFIVKDMFTNLPHNVQSELLSLSDLQLVTLTSLLFTEMNNSDIDINSNLVSVLSKLRECRMENLDIVSETSDDDLDNIKGLEYWDKIMAAKKTHEVDEMSKLVFQQVKKNNIQSLVDLGSGKAYLSQVLTSLYKVPVLAIDGKETNTKGAQNREKKLKSKWGGLATRAAERADGELASNRKTRTKKDYLRSNSDADSVNADLVTLTKFVETGSDIGDLVQEHLPATCDRVGIIGLHTCGDLAPSSLATFLESPSAVFLCNVGCCYNHLSDQGFPLSSHLKSSNFQMERSVKMLGVQPLDRLGKEAKMPSKSLLWRSVLEVIMNSAGVEADSRNVGRIAAKCDNFVHYLRKSEEKLSFDSKMSDSEVEIMFSNYESKFWKKLVCFYQFRALFALLIESIILTDRLLYLQESGIRNSSILKLFDSNISPRCYAVMAIKD